MTGLDGAGVQPLLGSHRIGASIVLGVSRGGGATTFTATTYPNDN